MAEPWLPDLTPGAAKYQAIADALGAAIETGRLRGGDRLPTQRRLAERLGIDLTTVTRAYEAARQRGLIEARGRAGSFVRVGGQATPHELAQIDTGMNLPPEAPGGLLGHALTETTRALLAAGTVRLQYQPAGGAPRDRAAGAALLARHGLASDAAQVVTTAGGQHALHAIASAALKPGDAVACGRFVYSGFRALATRLGLRLVGLAEMTADALDAACMQGARALYVVPTNDNPTAHTVPLAERRRIAEAARRHGIAIIEDDAYGLLAADPVPPIASFAPELCWHIASSSKLISPALRVAFVRAPDAAGAARLAEAVHETAIMAPPLNAAIVADWIGDGSFERLVSATRAEAAGRQAMALEMLAGVPHAAHPQGYHLWLPLSGVRAEELAEAMRPTGMSVIAARRFAVGDAPAEAVRVSLGGPIDRERLAGALHNLAAWLER